MVQVGYIGLTTGVEKRAWGSRCIHRRLHGHNYVGCNRGLLSLHKNDCEVPRWWAELNSRTSSLLCVSHVTRYSENDLY